MTRRTHARCAALLMGMLALGWAGYGYALSCVSAATEAAELELQSVTVDGTPTETTVYANTSVSLEATWNDGFVLVFTARNGEVTVEDYNAPR